jgi:alpha-2-macroglobulin
MKNPVPRRVRWTLPVAAGLVSCLHTVAPNVPPSATLRLSEAATGVRGRAPLAVVAAGPRGVIGTSNDPGITLVFNRSMRPVESPSSEPLPGVTVTTQDRKPIEGHFRWVGTHGLLFQPARSLPGSTSFLVTVPRGTLSLDGGRLASDYTLEFSTETTRLRGTFPTNGSNQVHPTDPLFLKFTQPVDPAELQAHLQLTLRLPNERQGRTLPVSVKSAAPHWAALPNLNPADQSLDYEKLHEIPDLTGLWLEVVPAQPLPPDSQLELTIARGLHSSQGPLPTEEPVKLSMRTYGPLRLADIRCARQNLGRCQAHRDFTVVFSSPVHPNDFRRFLKIEGPARPAKPVKGAPSKPLRPMLEHPLALDPDYGDHFKITLRAGLPDLYGQKLEKNVSADLNVEEPFAKPPAGAARAAKACESNCDTSDSESSERGNPDAPRRARLSYNLSVGVRGNILEALGGPRGASGPTAYKIPVSAVNVPTYGIYTRSLSEWSLVRELGKQFTAATENTNDVAWNWFTPGLGKNFRSVRQLDLAALLDGKPRGAAFIALAGLGQLESPVSSLVNLTDLGVSARVSRFGSLVWVTHLSSGTPVAQASVTVYNPSGDIVCADQTDAQGLVAFSSQQLRPITRQGDTDSRLLLVARAGDDFTYQRLQPTSNIVVEQPVDYLQKAQWAGFVFTDRGVYRPGEKVKVGGFFRQTAEKGFSVLARQEYQYTVTDAQGEIIASGDGKLDAFGALSGNVTLSKSAALGHANVMIRLGRHADETFSGGFEILSYKPAEFKVTVEPRQRDVVHQQSVTFDVDSEYLFGSPVAGARVRQYVTRTEVPYTPPGARGYVVDDAAFRQDLHFVTARGSAYAEFTGELDSKGRLSRTIALDAPQQAQAEELVLEANVQDISQQTQASRSQVLVHPAKFYIALRQPNQRFLAIGAQFPLQALALSPSGKKLAGIPLNVELWRRNWSSVVEDQPADVLHYKTHVRDVKAASCTVTTTDREVSCPLRLDEPGYYILRASSKDDLNNPVFASLGLYAVDNRADSTAAPASWRHPDGHKLDLEADQKIYQPGDVARILIKSPFNQATALVTVERAGLLDQKVVQLHGAMPVVDIPIKPEFFPNAYVSVHLLRGRVAAMPEIGAADVGAPDYRVGYTSLRVDPESHRLAVAVSAAHKEYHPGDLVDASVALRRPGGAPSAGTVTFYVVDEGVLLLTGYKTPDPLPAFSEPRTLGVYAVESREHLARFIKWRNGERIPSLGYEVAEGNADKGDEVGGGMDLPGRLRSDFKTTVYFESGRAVGADGQAAFHFKLPDNLTSFRLMAVAAGSEDRFGFGDGSITTNRPLMARPALPRSLRVGDTLQAGVIVTSKGASGSDVDVSLTAHGLTPLGPMQRRVLLPKNGQVEVRFPVKAETAGEASFEFSAKSGRDTDRVRLARKVEQPLRWLTAAATGSTDKAAAVALGNLTGYRKDMGDLTVTVSSSALVGLKSVFEGLSAYPYGCTEQLASRVLPLVAAPKLAEQQQVRLRATQSGEIDASLGEIAKRQRSDGSFGYWEDDRSVHPWLTAYALLALERGSQAGYFVPKRLRDHAVQYLMNVLYGLTAAQDAYGNDPVDEQESSEDSDDQSATASQADPKEQVTRNPREKLRITTAHAAFIADVLARLGQLDQSRVHQLLGFKSSLALSAKIQLLSAMARLRLPRQQLDAWLAEIMKEATVGENEAHVAVSDLALAELLESPTRSTAILLQAVLAIDGKHPLAQKLARGLVRLRTGAGYRNTQEDAWALLALEDYRKQEEPEAPQFGTQVFFGDALAGEFAFRGLPVHSETATITAEKLLNHPGDPISVKVIDHGTAHYSMLLRLAKDGASSVAIDEGFSIEKHLRAVEPAMLKQIATVIPDHSELRADLGQLVLVDMLLETAEPREQIVLNDPLPAGLEPVEFGFAISAQSLSSVEHAADNGVSMKSASHMYGRSTLAAKVHREMHDDHVVHFIEHLDPGIHHFRYLARATSPGQFVTPPTRASCMYDTEVFGQTASSLFEVASKH